MSLGATIETEGHWDPERHFSAHVPWTKLNQAHGYPFFPPASLSSTAPFVWYTKSFIKIIRGSTFIIFFSLISWFPVTAVCAHGSLVTFHVVCVGQSTLLPTESFSEVSTKWSSAFYLLFLECSTSYALCTHWDSFHSLQALLFFLAPPSSLSFPLLGLVPGSLNPCCILIFVYHVFLLSYLKSGFSELDRIFPTLGGDFKNTSPWALPPESLLTLVWGVKNPTGSSAG